MLGKGLFQTDVTIPTLLSRPNKALYRAAALTKRFAPNLRWANRSHL